MRSLSATLLANQKEMGDVLIKALLYDGVNPATLYEIDRIKESKHSEEPYRQSALLTLDNSDGEFTDLDLEGWLATISYGYNDPTQGEEYSATAPMRVLAQQTHDYEGILVCTLSLAGIPNFLGQDTASAAYSQDSSSSLTLKDLIEDVLDASLSPFSHCKSYTVTFDSGYDGGENMISTFMPADFFRVYKNDSRLSVIKRLLTYTECVMRVEADGQIHILLPTTTGSSYDYAYSLVSGEHNFYSKAYRRKIVIPGKITVASHPDHVNQYSGTAQDSAYSALPDELKFQRFYELRLGSNAEATSIAVSKLSKAQIDSERGSAVVTMNVGAEVYDYSNVVSSRASDERAGNLGYLNRHWKAGTEEEQGIFEMEIRFGAIALGGNLGTMPAQAVTSTLDYSENISQLWDAIDGIWAFLDTIIGYLESLAALAEPVTPEEVPPAQTEILWESIFDGSSDTPTSVDWALEAGLPFTPSVGTIYFSSIIEELPGILVVYIIDRSDENFWKYNITQKEWTKLASPTYSGENCYRTLAINPLGTRLACIGDGGSTEPVGRRIEIYDIGDDSWTTVAASSQSPTIVSQNGGLKSLVWEDNDTIWAWARDGTNLRGKCIKWVPSTDTFTTYSNNTGTLTSWQARNAAIKGTTIVYGGSIGDSVRDWFTYTIATDTYTNKTALSGKTFYWTYDKDKLWYQSDTTARQGYIDTADDSENDNQFADNVGRHAFYYGISDAGTSIIGRASATTPELDTVIAGGTYLLGTLYAGGWTPVTIEKPDDNYVVLVVNTADQITLSYDHAVQTTLWDGTWKFYYPQTGDYSQVKIKKAVS